MIEVSVSEARERVRKSGRITVVDSARNGPAPWRSRAHPDEVAIALARRCLSIPSQDLREALIYRIFQPFFTMTCAMK